MDNFIYVKYLSVRIILFVLFSIPFFITTVMAATFCVNSSSEFENALVTAASNGEDDTIQIEKGKYFGNFIFASTEDFNLSIKGGYTASCTSRVVDASNTVLDGSNRDSVLVIASDKFANYSVDGLTLQNGTAQTIGPSGGTSGGALKFSTNGSMTLTNSNVSGSSAGSGGGVCVESNDRSWKTGTSLTLSNNIISNNSALYGGGFCAFGMEKTTLSNNTIINNSTINDGGVGGGIYLSGSTIILTNNTVKNNISNGYENRYQTGGLSVGGGGIYLVSRQTAVLNNNTISDNSARSGSGGIFIAAESNISLSTSLSISLNNNIISNNSADIGGDFIDVGGGGGAYFYGSGTSTINVTNNTFAGNTAHNDGGGLMVLIREETAVANIYNNILWNNSANESADIYINNDGDADFLPSSVNLFNNIFDKSSTGINIQRPFTIDDSNLDKINPMFIGNGDYHLTEGSPCIDKGLNNAPSIPDKDFDDDQRIIDGDNDGRKIVDIGADEYFSDSVGRVLISGIIKYAGNPVCAMVLANGQYMFTCKAGDDFGKYELAVPLDDNEEITIQAFVSGLAPFRRTTNESDLDIDIDMQKADPESRLPSITTVTTTDASIQTGWSRITGTVNYDGSPLCAMVLANGQYMFSCGPNSGVYDLTVPLDGKGEITLYVFVAGFQPYKSVFTP